MGELYRGGNPGCGGRPPEKEPRPFDEEEYFDNPGIQADDRTGDYDRAMRTAVEVRPQEGKFGKTDRRYFDPIPQPSAESE